MSRGRGLACLPSLWLVSWALCCVLGCCPGPAAAEVASSPPADRPPRAVFVSLAHEHDLPAVVSSVSQLEDTFNSRYRYDWVFFSTSPLSEEFRRRTSNATKATCAYEVIGDDFWSMPAGDAAADSTPQTSPARRAWAAESDMEPESDEAACLVRQMRRWKSGPFAKESRLKSYDWFWIVEPGAQFVHDIDFDVFRAMRDHGIAYGSNRGGLDEARTRMLARRGKRTSLDDDDDDLGLEHAEEDVSWLLASAGGTPSVPVRGGGGGGGETEAQDGGVAPEGVAGAEAADGWFDDGRDEDDVGSPIEAFASRLGSLYRGSLWPAFEVGSLAFLRSQSHQALLEHLDKLDSADGLYDGGPPDDGSTPTLSANMFLPQKSVLHLRKRDRGQQPAHGGGGGGGGPSPPDSTPRPKFSLVRIIGDGAVGRSAAAAAGKAPSRRPEDDDDVAAERLSRWELMARDLGRQGGMPGLRSGHTVVDERNFILDAVKREVSVM